MLTWIATMCYYLVIGLPGDEIEMRNNRLIINGQPAQYDKLDTATINQIDASQQRYHRFVSENTGDEQHPIMVTPGLPSPHSFAPITVPEGHYVMLGDNRDNSKDSRSFGFVPRKNIAGQAVGVRRHERDVRGSPS